MSDHWKIMKMINISQMLGIDLIENIYSLCLVGKTAESVLSKVFSISLIFFNAIFKEGVFIELLPGKIRSPEKEKSTDTSIVISISPSPEDMPLTPIKHHKDLTAQDKIDMQTGLSTPSPDIEPKAHKEGQSNTNSSEII